MSKTPKLLPLGTKAFAVAKNFVDTGHHGAGAQVVPVKLLTYRNTGGIVQQIWESKKREITEEGWYIKSTLEEAVRLLKPPVHKKDWKPNDSKKPKAKRSNRRKR